MLDYLIAMLGVTIVIGVLFNGAVFLENLIRDVVREYKKTYSKK